MPSKALRISAASLAALAGLPAIAHAEAGMPQFDVTRFPSQIFWLIVSFAILYMLMAKLVLPRIGATIDARERKIQADLDAAQQANDAAKASAAAQDKALAEARGKAEVLIRTASDKAAAETSARLHEVAERLAGEITAAEQRIAAQRDQAMSGVGAMATDIASAVLAKLVGAADPSQVAQAVAAAAKAGKA